MRYRLTDITAVDIRVSEQEEEPVYSLEYMFTLWSDDKVEIVIGENEMSYLAQILNGEVR